MIDTSELISQFAHGVDADLDELATIVNSGLRGVQDATYDDKLNHIIKVCSSLLIYEPQLSKIAVRAQLDLLYRKTPAKFTESMRILKNDNIISDKYWQFVIKNEDELNKMIDESCDENYSHHGLETLISAYLLKNSKGELIERPQHLNLRVAIGVSGDIDVRDHENTMSDIALNYKLISKGYYTHATPTMFSASTKDPFLASCYLFPINDDLIRSIKESSEILHANGGIGLSMSGVTSVAPNSNHGSVNVAQVFNNLVRHIRDWSRRPTGIAVYMEPWHNDIINFIDYRKNNGKEEFRCRDIFTALWIPDLFMRRVEKDEMWSLMCPSKCPGLDESYGEQFDDLYLKYENEHKYERRIKAQDLFKLICSAQIETGNPSILFKDAANRKNNQQQLGVIKNSNLCTEIMEYSDSQNTAVCTLASLCLPKFVIDANTFDFDELKFVTTRVVKNLNNVIDATRYPTESCRRSNLANRPIGIGVQGLADVFLLMKMPYESERASVLNKQIFEVIYFAALEESCYLAMKHGSYPTYLDSPSSKGLLQFDLWKVAPTDMCDWQSLKELIKKYGLRNSLVTALMPTASTAQIVGNTESFEPLTTNIYQRIVASGAYQTINIHLYRELKSLNLWNKSIVNQIITRDGSIQDIDKIPSEIKSLYKTVWEMSMKKLIEMSADRAPFVDQSQSFNVYFQKPKLTDLIKCHFFSWKKGLKTGMYYLRCKPAAEAIKITITQDKSSVAAVCTNKKNNGIEMKNLNCCGC